MQAQVLSNASQHATRVAPTCRPRVTSARASLQQCRAVKPCFSGRPVHAVPAAASPAARHAKRTPLRAPLRVHANSLIVKDNTSGAEFPLGQTFWFGEQMRCLGAGTRVKKVLMFNAKVYSVALYVEGTSAAKELGIRSRGGFFETDDDYCQAILDGAQNKALVIRLVRDVDGPTFAEALEEALAPRMALMGETQSLTTFKSFFDDKQLTSGTEIVLFWSMRNDLQVALSTTAQETYTGTTPPLTIGTPGLPRALFELYLGSGSVVAEARKAWVQGVKNLLDYDNVKRNTRKDGA